MIDYLIIGQGLAGSLLAWELIRRGCSVVVIDNGMINASQIAAGLINPITGLRFVKSENIDTLLPSAKTFYSNLSSYFKQEFYIEKFMLRLFRNEEERSRCLKRFNSPDYQSFLRGVYAEDESFDAVEAPFGGLEQKQTGHLLTQSLLRSLKNFFIAKNAYRQASFDYPDIQFQPCLKWRDLCPRQIIFCEGHHSRHNPWFSCLPMQAVKGEILTLKHSLPLADKIINYGGHWLLPITGQQIRIGATFDRDYISTAVTEAAKSELLQAFKQLIPKINQAELIDQQAGIRPATSDRRPFIGIHPQYRQLAIFNGFGAKGSVLIPEHCRRFADYLLHNAPLPDYCNIERYYETHFVA